jgi:FkbM family methyltransferase
VPWISYAQNHEDVLLRRAFHGIDRGRYIDVGAADPEIDSVTKSFYDQGWSGINIEPHPEFFRRLEADRDRDLNLPVALGAEAGSTTLFAVEGYGELSTTVGMLADEYRADGRELVEHPVAVRTLAEICEGLGDQPIHFLKIDVEGGELDVLSGADFSAFRPWIVLVESVTFGTPTADQDAWERILLDAGYSFVWFDGLNRFYVAAEHAELAEHFTVPVNTTDDYTRPAQSRAVAFLGRIAEVLGLDPLAGEHEVLERLTALRSDRIAFEHTADSHASESESASERAAAAESEVERLRQELDAIWQQSWERERYIAWQAGEIQRSRYAEFEAHQQLAGFYRSASWRLSLPLRVARRPNLYVRKMLGR